MDMWRWALLAGCLTGLGYAIHRWFNHEDKP